MSWGSGYASAGWWPMGGGQGRWSPVRRGAGSAALGVRLMAVPELTWYRMASSRARRSGALLALCSPRGLTDPVCSQGMPTTYPSWVFYPRNARPPAWAIELVELTASVESLISTAEAPDPTLPAADRSSDAVLAHLCSGLQALGFEVETGKAKGQKISRPVLYGENGVPEVSYDIDAFHDSLGVAVEVEAGRGAANGADYRDIVRTSLLLDATALALFMPSAYRHKQNGKDMEKPAFRNTRRQLDAIYASRRLRLPFEGLLLVGY